MEEYEDAKIYLEKTTDIDQNYYQAYFHWAELLVDPEDYEKAKKNYLIAIDIKDNYIDAHFYLAKLLIGGLKNDKNGILVEKPEYDLAIKHLKKIIKLKKYFVQAYYLLGVIYRIEKQYDVSLKYLKKALGINDNYAKAHFEIAMLYRNIMDNRN